MDIQKQIEQKKQFIVRQELEEKHLQNCRPLRKF